jgi:hypothetical protein
MRVRNATHLACASGECHCTYHKAESRVAMHNSSYEALQAFTIEKGRIPSPIAGCVSRHPGSTSNALLLLAAPMDTMKPR